MPEAGAEQSPSDMREQEERDCVTSSWRRGSKPNTGAAALLAQIRKGRAVCRWQSTNDQVHSWRQPQQVEPHNLPQTPLHSIALDRSMRVTRHDNPHPDKRQLGSQIPNLEMCSSESPPSLTYLLEFSVPSQPLCAGEAAAIRRRRTWKGA